mgnify:CR=1 FL=1
MFASFFSSHCGVAYTIYKSESKLDRLTVPMTKAQVVEEIGRPDRIIRDDGRLLVDRLLAVVDCGTVVHPDAVDAQIRGSLIFGLGAALYQKISLAEGQVSARSFDDFRLPGFADLPELVVRVLALVVGVQNKIIQIQSKALNGSSAEL